MGLARDANRYLEEKGPWFEIKKDRRAAATTSYVALSAIDSLKTLLAPFLPFSSQRLHRYLGNEGSLFGESYVTSFVEEGRSHKALCYDGSRAVGEWRARELTPGQVLNRPEALFKKLDESVAERERSRLGAQNPETEPSD